MKTKKGMSVGSKVAIGAGLAALGAGAYYLLGPDAKANQKKVKSLITKMQKEVEKESKKIKDISSPLYNKAVDVISKNYAKQYKAHSKDIQSFAKKLKGEWKKVVK